MNNANPIKQIRYKHATAIVVLQRDRSCRDAAWFVSKEQLQQSIYSLALTVAIVPEGNSQCPARDNKDRWSNSEPSDEDGAVDGGADWLTAINIWGVRTCYCIDPLSWREGWSSWCPFIRFISDTGNVHCQQKYCCRRSLIFVSASPFNYSAIGTMRPKNVNRFTRVNCLLVLAGTQTPIIESN